MACNKKLLIKERLISVYECLEKPLIKIIADMENNGIKVHKTNLKYCRTLFKQLEKLQEKIFSCSGNEFNINSTKQLGEILLKN